MSEIGREEESRLSREDARLLDLLAENEFEPSALEGLGSDERRRVEAIMAVFGLMGDYPVEDADEDLVNATVLRVRRHGQLAHRQERAIGLSMVEPTARGWRIRMPDAISIAAVFLILISVGTLVLGQVRQYSIDAGCKSNLRALAQGFEMYARDYDGQIPMAPAGFSRAGIALWPDPVVLSEHNYCEHGHANCPGHEHGAGYSRQVVSANAGFAWLVNPAMPVMGDRNPVIDARDTGSAINPFIANSENHSQRGQNILMSDGSIIWLEGPLFDRDDNIWLIMGQRRFEPGDAPETLEDAFLAH
jgi:hypothetical protein